MQTSRSEQSLKQTFFSTTSFANSLLWMKNFGLKFSLLIMTNLLLDIIIIAITNVTSASFVSPFVLATAVIINLISFSTKTQQRQQQQQRVGGVPKPESMIFSTLITGGSNKSNNNSDSNNSKVLSKLFNWDYSMSCKRTMKLSTSILLSNKRENSDTHMMIFNYNNNCDCCENNGKDEKSELSLSWIFSSQVRI